MKLDNEKYERLEEEEQWVDRPDGIGIGRNAEKSHHVGTAYFVPGAILFVGSCLLLLASWRAGLVLSYPDRLWQINVPAMLGLVFMLVGFLGIFWVNVKER